MKHPHHIHERRTKDKAKKHYKKGKKEKKQGYIPFLEAAQVTLGGVEAAEVDCVVAGTGTEVVRTVEEVATPAPLGLDWGTSSTINKS